MNELHLFAGAGGGILAGQLLGHRCVCAVEWEPYAQAVLVARQNDGTFPPFPIWDDVQTFNGKPWIGIVDVVCGGFPCQDISAAGKGAGIEGKRSGMWSHMARIVDEIKPKFVFIENSPLLVGRGLSKVLCDLAKIGYDAKWTRLSAFELGANHERDRIWILAKKIPYSDKKPEGFKLHNENSIEMDWNITTNKLELCYSGRGNEEWKAHTRWPTEPTVGRVVNGVANRAHRLKAIGNGQVPRVAAAAFNILKNS